MDIVQAIYEVSW